MGKVFLYGYYGFGNVGDDLLLAAILRRLRSAAPDSSFVVRSLHPVADLQSENVEFSCQERILLQPNLPKWRRLLDYLAVNWRSLAGCRAMVFGGGTLFHARGGALTNLVLIFLAVVQARLRGARVFVLGAGVAEMPGISARLLMAAILALSDDFAVRDASSWRHCRQVIGGNRVRRTADLVFSLQLPTVPTTSAGKTVGVTLAASDIGAATDAYPQFFSALAADLAELRDKGWSVRLLSFQELDDPQAGVSDTKLLQAVGIAGERVELLRVSSDPDALCRQFAELDIVVGMRFHGLVMAALLGLPFVGIGRDSKLSDFCLDAGMPFLSLSEARTGVIAETIEGAAGRMVDGANLASWQALSAENFGPIEEYLK
ncbi:polysaccharide pyruvyl transferase family protein [Methylomonas koyamae]|uniref:polysaccharide pyruvyl transferase family protein n=1 Tax=Methylomonas koyamae TaxID=702114 RepID=UPI0016432AE9|nr:polysaccharide pyruvyl transferase family protein [Methylomonas koyamae]